MSGDTSVIFLTTGLPGAGKTLRTIQDVEALRKASGRAVYYSGINQLTLEGWSPFGGPGPNPDRAWETNPADWHLLPANSIIVIVEAQRLFRPQGLSKVLPPYVAALEVLRHQGQTLFLDTQHPTFLDPHVRKLVGTHRHLMRKFGSQWSTLHEWHGGTRDNCDKSRKDSISTQWRYPAQFFGVYKSAEAHTVKFRLPLKLWLALCLPLVVIALFWWVLAGRTIVRAPVAVVVAPGEGVGVAGSSGLRVRSVVTAQSLYESLQPRIVGLPHTAPRYDEITVPVRAPIIAGCWSQGQAGYCMTQQGTRLSVPLAVRVAFIKNGSFLDFDPEGGAGQGKSPGDSSVKSPMPKAVTPPLVASAIN